MLLFVLNRSCFSSQKSCCVTKCHRGNHKNSGGDPTPTITQRLGQKLPMCTEVTGGAISPLPTPESWKCSSRTIQRHGTTSTDGAALWHPGRSCTCYQEPRAPRRGSRRSQTHASSLPLDRAYPSQSLYGFEVTFFLDELLWTTKGEAQGHLKVQLLEINWCFLCLMQLSAIM